MLLFISIRFFCFFLRFCISIHPMLLFIILKSGEDIILLNFNTSHVTVYQRTNNVKPGYNYDFNTSHVTVYPRPSLKSDTFFIISIHPMLLFITFVRQYLIARSTFQYIPCYCLSTAGKRPSIYAGISIHPMLLFISALLGFQQFYHFNTSHVTVYLCRELKILATTNISIHPMLLFIDFKVFRNYSEPPLFKDEIRVT